MPELAWTIAPVDAIGRETVRGFGRRSDGTPIYEWEIDIFPPSPNGKKLRDLRKELAIGLREAAKALGISAAELSSLERGGATCGEWEELFQALSQRLFHGCDHPAWGASLSPHTKTAETF